MLSIGTRLSLNRQTVALGLENEKRVVVLVPIGDVIEILPGFSEGDITVEVMWESQQVTMFSVDVEERGRVAKAKGAPHR